MVYCRTPNKEFGWLMLKIPNLQYGLLEIFHFFLTLPKSVFIKVNKSYPQCNEGGIPWLDLLGNLLGKHQQSTIHPPNDCMAGRTLHSYKCYFSRRQTLQWRRKWQPTLVFLPGESHGQRSLAGYSPWDHKAQTRLSN